MKVIMSDARLQTPRTLYEKVFDAHIVDEKSDGTVLIYIGTNITTIAISWVSNLTPLVFRQALDPRSLIAGTAPNRIATD